MSDKRIQKLDLNLLRIFEAMYFERNMTRTAETLYLTPSAVSHAMKRLRDALQDPLFERQGSKMEPTSACLRIAPQILENLNSLRKSLQQFSAFDPKKAEQQFTLAVHDALEPLYVPALFRLLAQTSEGLGLSCIKLERQQLQRQLGSGQADLAIDVAMPLQRPINHCRLASDRFVILMKKDSQFDGQLTRRDYTEARHLTVSNRPTGRVIEDITLQQQSINRKIAIRCQSYHTAKAILKDQDFLLTVPELIGRSLLDEELQIQAMPFDVPNIDIHLYWHENAANDSAINWLKDKIIGLSQ
ncbi:LysR family transcriptional regulator [Planctobacterium marinum]|uniref:LysR family transcriptional regulator n=1 Tax=Planctobacterium marinum TaxID=1631968 RepID=A0AA48HI70_9ALTE|nr:LysR family transcriptional regulator [Planctobacterium marinum]